MNNNNVDTRLETKEIVENEVKDNKELLFTFAKKECGCGGNCNGSCK